MSIISKILRYLKKRKNQIIRIAMIAMSAVAVVSIVSAAHYQALYNKQIESTRSEEGEVAALSNENSELETKNEELNVAVQDQQEQLEAYKTQVESLQKQVESLTQQNAKLNKQLANNITYPDKEYVMSTAVWNHLKSLGLNDYVCAGILGNIMAEVGGHTLDISKYACKESGGYYGMCQWAGARKERLLNDYGRSLSDQIEFLGVELFEVIPANSSFYNMQDEKEAALYFAKYYERCSSKYYSVRQSNATKALEYFT